MALLQTGVAAGREGARDCRVLPPTTPARSSVSWDEHAADHRIVGLSEETILTAEPDGFSEARPARAVSRKYVAAIWRERCLESMRCALRDAYDRVVPAATETVGALDA